jgi:hypothetical protein
MVKIVAVFGTETWGVNEMEKERLGTWDRKILRRIHGPMVEQGIWRIKTDHELMEIYKYPDIVTDIERRN